MADSDRPEQDELNKRMMEQRKLIDSGKKKGKYRMAAFEVSERPYLRSKQKNIQRALCSAEWEEFMLGCDPAWHEYKGKIKQDND